MGHNCLRRSGRRARAGGLTWAVLSAAVIVRVWRLGGLARSLVAAGVAARFADGIRLAELASIQDQAQVPAAVAAVLGVRQAPGAPVLELLAGC